MAASHGVFGRTAEVKTIDRAELRRQIREMSPEDAMEAFSCLAEACAEYARELRLDVPDFVEFMVECHATAHDKAVVGFECAETDIGPKGVREHTTLVTMVQKWGKS
jgi:hypothetical protein